MLSLTLIAAAALQMSAAESALLSCRSITANDARLACYDRAAARLETETENRAETRAAEARMAFGQTEPQPEAGEDGIESIEAAIEDISINRSGLVTVTLDNGQVWRQLSSNGLPIRSSQLRRAERAVVETAAIGSYRMRIEPLGRSFKVKRVR